MAYLAVAISGEDPAQMCGQIISATAGGAEMLELRLDYLADLDADLMREVLSCAKETDLPVIATCRDKAQGGVGGWSQEHRVDILIEATKAGADFIDCEYDTFLAGETQQLLGAVLINHSRTRLILSAHDFSGKFSDLDDLYNRIVEAAPAAIPKLVYTANHINDCFEAFDLLRCKTGDAIVLCMGPAGLISRVLAGKLGSFLTFASSGKEEATAPGQITVSQMKGLFRWGRINADTTLFGVIGSPVAHSFSPAIFNASFDVVGRNNLYLPIQIDGGKAEFDEFFENILIRKSLGFSGFSVTLPHKSNAIAYLKRTGSQIEPLATAIGAVNTLKVGLNGRLSGYNTDYAGAIDALVSAMGIGRHDLHSAKVAVIGAGGVARAVVAGLCDVGAKVTIYNRTLSKAEGLGSEFGAKAAPLDAAAECRADVLINCTSIGMHPDIGACPVPKSTIGGDMVVFDTVYNPAETLLLKYAKAAGAKAVCGAEMFIRQAMAQYKIFTGSEADEQIMQIMRKTVFDCLGR